MKKVATNHVIADNEWKGFDCFAETLKWSFIVFSMFCYMSVCVHLNCKTGVPVCE